MVIAVMLAPHGWVSSADFAAGYVLLTADGRSVIVQSVRLEQQRRRVYNLHIADTHTYFVGTPAAWAHNSYPRHYTESKDGISLFMDALAYRKFFGNNNKKMNLLVADIEVNGVRGRAMFFNDIGALHSEQKFVAWMQEMQDKGHKVTVNSIFTERPPCGGHSANCQELLRAIFGPDIPIYFRRPGTQ